MPNMIFSVQTVHLKQKENRAEKGSVRFLSYIVICKEYYLFNYQFNLLPFDMFGSDCNRKKYPWHSKIYSEV